MPGRYHPYGGHRHHNYHPYGSVSGALVGAYQVYNAYNQAQALLGGPMLIGPAPQLHYRGAISYGRAGRIGRLRGLGKRAKVGRFGRKGYKKRGYKKKRKRSYRFRG